MFHETRVGVGQSSFCEVAVAEQASMGVRFRILETGTREFAKHKATFSFFPLVVSFPFPPSLGAIITVFQHSHFSIYPTEVLPVRMNSFSFSLSKRFHSLLGFRMLRPEGPLYMMTHLLQQPALSPGSATSILPSGARAPKAPEPEGYDDISLL